MGAKNFCFQWGVKNFHTIFQTGSSSAIAMNTLKTTLMCLIEGQALINWQGGIFSKFNKRAGSNKEAGWNIFSNLIRGQERFVPYKRAGWKFNK